MNNATLAGVLSDSWTDSNGDSFSSSVTAAYDAQNQVYTLDNEMIVDELTNNRPLLYANKHHCMLVVSIDFLYRGQQVPPVVQGVGVLDPWPYSLAYHPLMASELIPANLGGDMMFLATVSI